MGVKFIDPDSLEELLDFMKSNCFKVEYPSGDKFSIEELSAQIYNRASIIHMFAGTYHIASRGHLGELGETMEVLRCLWDHIQDLQRFLNQTIPAQVENSGSDGGDDPVQ